MRLAIVISHPVQYYAPWFAHLANEEKLSLRVYYLWDFGVTVNQDSKFGQSIKWDLDLLSGYEHEFVPNQSPRPGTSHFNGLHNPKLFSRLNDWEPHAIMVFGYGWRTLLSLAIRWKKCPLILRGDSHAIIRSSKFTIRGFLRRLFLQKLFKYYSAFACVGKANRHFYLAHQVPHSRLFAVPHCVDNSRFASVSDTAAQLWRTKNGISQTAFLILFAGKFEKIKCPDLLISAFSIAVLPNAHLVLVGNGEMRQTLEHQISTTDRAVSLLPFHNQTTIPAALRAANVIVLPSESETWGLIINEAMACGTPAIVSSHVGCAEDLIIEDQTGWSFPAGKLTALSKKIERAHAQITANPTKYFEATTRHIANYSYAKATSETVEMLAVLGTNSKEARP